MAKGSQAAYFEEESRTDFELSRLLTLVLSASRKPNGGGIASYMLQDLQASR